jgi:hypothetical protein
MKVVRSAVRREFPTTLFVLTSEIVGARVVACWTWQ